MTELTQEQLDRLRTHSADGDALELWPCADCKNLPVPDKYHGWRCECGHWSSARKWWNATHGAKP
jgi:hypothetical protein